MTPPSASSHTPAAVPARTAILGTGSGLPGGVLTSQALERRLKLPDGTLEAAVGVRERRVAAPQEAVSDLAVVAGERALADAGIAPGDVGLLVLATSTPDHPVPATAPHVAHRLGLPCPAFDLMNTCSGWVYALAVADRWLRAGAPGGAGAGPGGPGVPGVSGASHALVIGANVLSRRVDWKGDWSVAGLFGDGAGAVVLGPSTPPGETGPGGAGILSTALLADGSGWEKIVVPAGGSRLPLTPELVAGGQHLLRIEKRPGMTAESVALLAQAARQALLGAGLEARDVDWFLPHQASARLLAEAARELGIPPERTLRNLERYGNTSAASIPLLLDEASRDGRIRAGQRLLLAVVAAGMTAGAAVVQWGGRGEAGAGIGAGAGTGGGPP